MSRDPADPIENLQREFERLFHGLVYRRHPSSHFAEPAWSPAADLVVSRSTARVLIELAGVPRENVRVRLRGRELEITGRRSQPERHSARTTTVPRSVRRLPPRDRAAVGCRPREGAGVLPRRHARGRAQGGPRAGAPRHRDRGAAAVTPPRRTEASRSSDQSRPTSRRWATATRPCRRKRRCSRCAPRCCSPTPSCRSTSGVAKSVRLLNDDHGRRPHGRGGGPDGRARSRTRRPPTCTRSACVGTVLRMVRFAEDRVSVLLQGVGRVRLAGIRQTEPYLRASSRRSPRPRTPTSVETEALTKTRARAVRARGRAVAQRPRRGGGRRARAGTARGVADFIASLLDLPAEDKQLLLETLDAKERLRLLTGLLQPRAAGARGRPADPGVHARVARPAPARVLAAPADGGHPQGAGRGRRRAARGRGPPGEDREGGRCRPRCARRPTASSTRLARMPAAGRRVHA